MTHYQHGPNEPTSVIGVYGTGGLLHPAIARSNFQLGGMPYFGPWVIDCSPEKGVALRPHDEFARGRACHPISYLDMFPPDQIFANAVSMLGQPYDLFSANCQHFTSLCATGRARSEQLEAAYAVGALIALTAVVARLAA